MVSVLTMLQKHITTVTYNATSQLLHRCSLLMCTNASEKHSVSKIAFYQIFTAVKASISYFKNKCMS